MSPRGPGASHGRAAGPLSAQGGNPECWGKGAQRPGNRSPAWDGTAEPGPQGVGAGRARGWGGGRWQGPLVLNAEASEASGA